MQDDPESIKRLLEEFIHISYRYEKDVKDAKALYEWLIETLPQAVWVYNQDGSFFYRNTQAIELQPIIEQITTPAKSKTTPNFTALTTDSKPSELEIEHGGRIFLVQINSFQSRMLITATDITTQKRQARLASMGQISAHLAHEIRNPIGSMSLLASVLQRSASKEQEPIIDELQKSIFRVERIIKATLLFSKGISANKQPMSLIELQDELSAYIKSYSFSKQIDFDFDFADQVARLDKDLILIALQNFLFNAIDAIEESENPQGRIQMRGSIANNEVEFVIKDDGKPFDDPNILFEPFVTTKLKGNGLGLALSNQIVHAHLGRIELDIASKEFHIFMPKV
ncbi:hypothetical protein BKN38_09290 [Helicobacter sp. CLO-3]|nr:hypothetical protein BA723_03630 [Helicobacter sp. CLO-3]OHU81332.1 hypothetical protein BKN38_09290 [Helicobacter sp. CLO-3]